MIPFADILKMRPQAEEAVNKRAAVISLQYKQVLGEAFNEVARESLIDLVMMKSAGEEGLNPDRALEAILDEALHVDTNPDLKDRVKRLQNEYFPPPALGQKTIEMPDGGILTQGTVDGKLITRIVFPDGNRRMTVKFPEDKGK